MDFLPYGLKFLLVMLQLMMHIQQNTLLKRHKDFTIKIGKEGYLNTENNLQNFIDILTTQMCSPKTV